MKPTTPNTTQQGTRLHVIASEEPPAYDAGMPEAPPQRRHLTMISDGTVEGVAALGTAALGLYCYLERLVGRDGRWRCRLAEIAEAFGCTERHVRDVARSLEEAGYIERRTTTGRNGVQTGVEFYLPHHIVRTNYPEPRAEPTPELSRAHVNLPVNKRNTTTSPLPPTVAHPSMMPTLLPSARTDGNLLAILDGTFPDVSASFEELDERLSSSWLRRTLANCPCAITPTKRQIKDALYVAYRQAQAAFKDKQHPVGNPQGFVRKLIVDEIGGIE